MALVVAGSADANLIAKWDERLRACQQERVKFEAQWHKNMLFYFGKQWIIQQSTANGFAIREEATEHPWRVRHTANRILRIVRTELTKLTKEEPQYFCMPNSTEQSDRLAAMAGDAIAEHIIRTKYFNNKRTQATLWALLCGTGFLKNYYDPNKKDIDGLPGRIDFEAVTAFHLFVGNLQQPDIQEQDYVCHARTMSPENVWTAFGADLPADTDSVNLILDSRFSSAVGINTPKSDVNKQCYVKEWYVKPCRDFPNGAMFVYGGTKMLYVFERQEPMPEDDGILDVESEELLEPPAPFPLNPVGFVSHPEGDPEVIPPRSDFEGLQGYNHEFGYRHGRFPFAKIDHIPTGMFYARSVIEALIPLQKEYNRTRSIMLEQRNLAGKPQWYFTQGAFDLKKWNTKPGLLLPVHMGFEPPKPLEQPPLPPSVTNELEMLLRDMDDAASQFEVAKGRTPPGVEAASAIAYLQEENDTILYHTVQSLEDAVQETGIQVLANVHDYWPEDRVVRMTSRNQFMEVREFKKENLNPLTDFRVEAGSMAPRSLAAKQAFITELLKLGAIDSQKALRYLQMSETNKLYEELMIDVRHAQRENVYMSQGQKLTKPDLLAPKPEMPPPEMLAGLPPEQLQTLMQQMMTPPNKTDVMRDPMTGEPQVGPDGKPVTYEVTINGYDAHEVHIEEHQNFQKSQEYEMLSSEIQQIIQDHVDEHKMEILKERNAIQTDQTLKGEQEGEETIPPRELGEPEPSMNGQGQ